MNFHIHLPSRLVKKQKKRKKFNFCRPVLRVKRVSHHSISLSPPRLSFYQLLLHHFQSKPTDTASGTRPETMHILLSPFIDSTVGRDQLPANTSMLTDGHKCSKFCKLMYNWSFLLLFFVNLHFLKWDLVYSENMHIFLIA